MGKTFTVEDDLKPRMVVTKNGQKFFERGVLQLPEKWQNIIDQPGKHSHRSSINMENMHS